MRWCDGSYIEDQDKWWLSGIYREVVLVVYLIAHVLYLYAVGVPPPKAHGSDDCRL